jgi:hypothetical protein
MMMNDRSARDGHLKLSERREVFKAVVEAQDLGTPLQASRELVAKRFGISEERVRSIEKEGLEEEWPPLEP